MKTDEKETYIGFSVEETQKRVDAELLIKSWKSLCDAYWQYNNIMHAFTQLVIPDVYHGDFVNTTERLRQVNILRQSLTEKIKNTAYEGYVSIEAGGVLNFK